jgi:hypothetical protein
MKARDCNDLHRGAGRTGPGLGGFGAKLVPQAGGSGGGGGQGGGGTVVGP